jgi:hypothetical protein
MAPLLLIVGDEIAVEIAFIEALKRYGWSVENVCDGATALAALWRRPALLVFAPTMADERLARLREAGGPAACAVALALVPPGDGDFDDYIDPSWSIERQVEAVDRWRPDGAAAIIMRLEAAFGRTEMHAMLARLKAALIEALATFDQSAIDQAHRLAGLAGTLGFAAASRAWRAVSEGTPLGAGEVRRQTRLAIAAIDVALRADEAPSDPLPD